MTFVGKLTARHDTLLDDRRAIRVGRVDVDVSVFEILDFGRVQVARLDRRSLLELQRQRRLRAFEVDGEHATKSRCGEIRIDAVSAVTLREVCVEDRRAGELPALEL